MTTKTVKTLQNVTLIGAALTQVTLTLRLIAQSLETQARFDALYEALGASNE